MDNNNNSTNYEAKKNKYAEYLPENRYKNEGMNVNPKILKISLVFFWCVVIAVGIGIALHFKGIDILKVESRNYNLNLNETIDLTNLSKESGITWQANSDDVIIEDNVLTAINSGTVYIIGYKDNKQVSDLIVNVLSGDKAMYLENHSIEVPVNGKEKINVIKNEQPNRDENNPVYNESFKPILYENKNPLPSGNDEDGGIPQYYEDEEDDDEFIYSDTDITNADETNDDNTISSIDAEEPINNNNSNNSTNNNPNIIYSSSDDKIATVDNSGNIKPKSPGTVIITATDENGEEDDAYVTVTEEEEEELSVKSHEYNIKEGTSVEINYNFTGRISSKSWRSNNPAVAKVDQNGKVTGIKEGIAQITLTINSKTETISIKVEKDIIEVENININSANLTLIKGNSKKITATVSPSNATNKIVTWRSKKTSIATVDNNGKITAINSGTTTITATASNGKEASITLTVIPKVVYPTGITLSVSKSNLKVGETAKLTYTFNPAGTTERRAIYDYDKNFIQLDGSGNITALAGGTTTITVKTVPYGKTDSVTLKITSDKVTSIKIKEGNINLKENDTKQLTTEIKPSNLNKTVTWESSNREIVTVSQTGLVKALKKGTAIITAKCDGKTTSITVNITANIVRVTSLKLSKTNINLKEGKISEKIIATISPSNASNKTINWKPSNASVATIKDGIITAHNKGTTTITATCDGKTATINITVTEAEKEYKIFINPSHQYENSTVSQNKDYNTEKKSMYIMANNLKTRLENKGYKVYLAPKGDSSTGQGGCKNFGNENKNCTLCACQLKEAKENQLSNGKNIYIALHSNATGGRTNTTAYGPQVYYAAKTTNQDSNMKSSDITISRNLATNLCSKLKKVYNDNNLKLKDNYICRYANTDTNVYEPSFFYRSGIMNSSGINKNFGKKGVGAAVLIEIGFHDHKENQKFIENHNNELVSGIVDGIEYYIKYKT